MCSDIPFYQWQQRYVLWEFKCDKNEHYLHEYSTCQTSADITAHPAMLV